jgi:hypothetical protein
MPPAGRCEQSASPARGIAGAIEFRAVGRAECRATPHAFSRLKAAGGGARARAAGSAPLRDRPRSDGTREAVEIPSGAVQSGGSSGFVNLFPPGCVPSPTFKGALANMSKRGGPPTADVHLGAAGLGHRSVGGLAIAMGITGAGVVSDDGAWPPATVDAIATHAGQTGAPPRGLAWRRDPDSGRNGMAVTPRRPVHQTGRVRRHSGMTRRAA